MTVEFVVTEPSTGPRKRFREMNAAHGGGHDRGLPWLAPIRNSFELRGLCRRSYFGPRTCGRGITNISKCAGLSIRVSPSHPYNAGRAGLGWIETFRGSQSGFPLLTPTMQAGQDSGGGGGGGVFAQTPAKKVLLFFKKTKQPK